jgi:septal ring-binding cell division protein DamX
MPELNLIEEDSSGGSSATPAAAAKRRPPKGGGFGKVLIILIALIVVLAAVFLANQYGYLNLWGKKAAPATAEQQTFPEEPFQGAQADSTAAAAATGTEVKQPAEAATKPDSKASEKLVEPRPQPKAARPEASRPAGDVSTMSGQYTIQFSAWKEKGVADDLMGRLVRAGLPAFVEHVKFNGQTWYTVRVGRYGSPQEAQSALKNMPREIREHYWIDKIRTQ